MKKMKSIYLLAIMSLLLVFAAACGNKSDEGKPAGGGSKEKVSGSIVVSGSSAMQPLVAAAAEQFMEENPEADIQVQAGGSGTGLSQVSEGAVQIGNSDVFAEEKEGIPADQLKDHKIAVVGMTAAVNPEVGIKDISKEDLIKVFTGKVKNWKELGGKDQKIALINRPDSSGTRATFVKYGLDGQTPADGAATEDSSNTVKKLIKETPGAIGYLAFSYFNDDSVTPLSIDGVEPKDENVQNGKFPIWAYEHSYTKGEPKDLTKAFLEYMQSKEIQDKLVPDQGYIGESKMKVERNAEGKISEK
ncbi:phosphate ABC transporter substrate-binding protein [Fictibacillus barbaricus]|uniref:Phosphate-binding protein n=1 Tax=Fictibacillus barbaricus TaxID=182136 RepID=A0ABU1TZX7_9BACL|nr:phosphate ABC transporter substrate-binding protein [Fictibacillus barbaricus]MDR7072750.1 phosphate transport system substrate-binding protein [Fictibacillus barbaricus]